MKDNKYLYDSVKNTVIIAVFLALVLMLYDFRYSVSIVIGILFSTFNLVVYNYYFKSILTKENYKAANYVPFYFLIALLIVVPLLLGVLLPNVFNIWFIVLGLLLNKIVLYVSSIIFKK